MEEQKVEPKRQEVQRWELVPKQEFLDKVEMVEHILPQIDILEQEVEEVIMEEELVDLKIT
jgi:hypothetical protein